MQLSQILSRQKNNEKFADHIIKVCRPQIQKLCPRSLASASRVSVLEESVLELGFFLSRWPWPRTLGPQLHFCFVPLAILSKFCEIRKGPRMTSQNLLQNKQRNV